ncbi:protein RRNAD1-like [Pomacea canaliculata]|uniref:protein RRNAD1-like n=1 Tax=Pomacea canaliculata TaxID=400727 RepID=UPI000D727BCA|nr:protein RRNAD1-like [Pomacea canaliculata]
MASLVTSNANTVLQLKLHLNHVLRIINEYRWIIEAYVSDFFVERHWDRLPLLWQQYLQNIEFSQLSCLLTGKPWHCFPPFHRVCPLSLLALKVCIHRYSLDRHYVDVENPYVLSSLASAFKEQCYTSSMSKDSAVSSGAACSSASTDMYLERTPKFKNGQLMEMKHIFRKHVKPKKQHEIQNLSKVIKWLCGQSHSHHVVDVGAGLGHLSRLLTFGYNLKVTTLEAADGFKSKASKFDWELEKDILKNIKRTNHIANSKEVFVSSALPEHISCTVQPSISTEEFLHLVSSCSTQLFTENGSTGLSASSTELENIASGSQAKRERQQVECMNVDAGHQFKLSTDRCEDSDGTVIQVLQASSAVVQSVEEHSVTTGINNEETCSIHQENVVSHTTMYKHLNRPTIPEIEYKQTLSKHEKTDLERTDGDNRLVLAGLHACGDLTAVLLRVFATCDAVVALASVACCYMKLSCQSKQTQVEQLEHGYPLSQYLQGLANNSLTYETRELACHFADTYAQRLLDNPPHLKVHAYRAAMQHVIMQMKPEFKTGDIRLVIKAGAELSFFEYACSMFKESGY